MLNTFAGAQACANRPPLTADGVHLHNISPTGKELVGNILQFLTGDKRLFKQGAAAAGK